MAVLAVLFSLLATSPPSMGDPAPIRVRMASASESWPEPVTGWGTDCDHGVRVIRADHSWQSSRITARVVVPVEMLIVPSGRNAARILKSSGDVRVDHDAIVMAQQAWYVPAMKKCRWITGTYIFRAGFDP